jgi:general secretion pathway protein B
MSYILDALRKSEQERQRGRLPDIASMPEQPAAMPPRARGWVLILGIVLVNAGGWAAWWFWGPSQQEPTMGSVAPAVQEASPVAVAATAPDRPDTRAAATAASPALREQGGQMVPAGAVIPAQPYQQVIVIPQGTGALVQPAVPGQNLPVTYATPVMPTDSTVIQPRQFVQEPLNDASAMAAIEDGGAVMPPPPAPPLPPDLARPIEPGAPGMPDVSYLPKLEELPPALRSRVPSMTFSSHMFSSMEQFRSVVINGQRMRQGSVLQPGLELASITENGVVLTIDGTPFQVDILGNWSR